MKPFLNHGFALCAVALLAACQPQGPDASDMLPVPEIPRDSDPVVARIDGTPLYFSDVRRAALAQGLVGPDDPFEAGDPVFELTMEELIDQRLLALDGVRTGIDRDPEALRRLAAARERILGNLRVETHLAEEVNEESILELYEAQNRLVGRSEERRVRQIVVADQQTAITVAERLADEEDFEALVDEFSTDEATRSTGGDLGWVSREMLPAPLRTPIFTAEVGSRTEPVESEAGWHVIEIRDRRNPSPRTFEETREEIARFMTFDAIQSLVTTLREEAEIEMVYQAETSDSDEATQTDDTPEP